MSRETPFRARVETLLKMLYSGDRRPNPTVTDTAASWMVDDAEIWGTCGAYDRLTRAVLGAHRLRLAIALTARRGEPGWRVVVSPRWIAPDDAARHHPGLGDLAEDCYTMGGRPSPVALLKQARPLIDEVLMGYEIGQNPGAAAIAASIDSLLAERRIA